MSTMFTFSIFSVIFLAIGVVLYVMSDQVVELEKRYDVVCADNLHTGTCSIPFQVIEKEIKGPIYVYY